MTEYYCETCKEWHTGLCPRVDAQERIANLHVHIAELKGELEEERQRNKVFTACLHKANKLYIDAHPEAKGWPDGAINMVWLLESFDNVKSELTALREQVKWVPVSERLPEVSEGHAEIVEVMYKSFGIYPMRYSTGCLWMDGWSVVGDDAAVVILWRKPMPLPEQEGEA